MKKKSCKLRKIRFYCEYSGIHVPASSTIFELVKKVCVSCGSVVDKKCAKQSCYFCGCINNLDSSDWRRTHFCSGFLRAVHEGILDPKLTFSQQMMRAFQVNKPAARELGDLVVQRIPCVSFLVVCTTLSIINIRHIQ